MKTLLYKQLRLVCQPMTLVFCLFGVMLLIPAYPYTVMWFYVMLGLFFSFLNGREQKDVYYSALLPIRKRDTVKANCLFVGLIELLALVIAVPFALLRAKLGIGDNPVGLNANVTDAVRRVQRRVPAVLLPDGLQGGRILREGVYRHGGGGVHHGGRRPLPGTEPLQRL